jgi:hypothetical protein
VVRSDVRSGIIALSPKTRGERDLSWLSSSWAPFLSADDHTILITEEGIIGGVNYALCIRETDGSAVVRLGDGLAQGLSPDGKWALSIGPPSKPGPAPETSNVVKVGLLLFTTSAISGCCAVVPTAKRKQRHRTAIPANPSRRNVATAQRRVMTAIEVCRTAAFGGHLERCDQCGHERKCFNSCRDRHCPKCQSLARA